MKPALIYLRVSTQRQATDGVGLDAQFDRCQALARSLGRDVVAVYTDEGLSGRAGVDRRRGLAGLLEHARELPEALIVVYSLSRLARTQRLLWQLLDVLDVASATEPIDTSTPTGRAVVGMLSTFAALEADLASERTKDALAAARARGVRLGARPMHELAPDAVAVACELRSRGLSLRATAAELNRRGVAGARGGRWHPRTVRRALA